MRKLFLSSTMLVALTLSARADVILENKLSGTGFNVVFDSVNPANHLAVGSFNDAAKHNNLVDFTDLSGNSLFTGSKSGNDIKIANTDDLKVQVFAADGVTVVGTIEQVFSLKGTGDVHLGVFANDAFGNPEAVQNFDLGLIDPHAQSGFTLTTTKGEVMTSMVLLDVGGNIADFEHYRIDVAGPAGVPVPGPLAGAGFPGIIAGCLTLLGLARRRLFSIAA